MRIHSILHIGFVFLLSFGPRGELSAQSASWGFHGQAGYVLPHRSEMHALVTGHSWGFGAERGSWSQNGWRAEWRDGRGIWEGVEYAWLDAGSSSMGQIVSAMWKVKIPVWRSVTGELGSGLGWALSPYDLEKRPLSFALGTHLNAGLHLGLSAKLVDLGSHEAVITAGLTHFSNGAVSMPNLGINNLFLRLCLIPQRFIDHAPLPQNSLEIPQVKWSGFSAIRTGIRDVNLPGGVRHPVSSCMAGVLRHYSTRFAAVVAADLSYNQSLRETTGIALSAMQRTQWASQLGVDVCFGRAHLVLLQGWVWSNPDAALGRRHLHAAFGYELWPQWRLEIGLRSFRLRADYAYLGISRAF